MTGIKICGIKYDEDIGIINELKPDYAGMVLFFEKSKRNIAIDRAAEMIKKLDKNIQKTAVVVSPDINQIKAITDVGFDYIQIHKDMPDDILEKITIPVIRAVNMPDEINGAETENVLLLGEDVRNKTIPLILCAEEDVNGSHGATIGELDEETLFYYASRGIDKKNAEDIMTKGRIEVIIRKINDEDTEKLAEEQLEEVLQ